MGGYVPNTKEQRQDMLKAIGLSSMEDLFVDIPQEVRLKNLRSHRASPSWK